jgi:hydrogenase expression/formation protein HypC
MEICGDDPLARTGRVSFGGVVKEVNLACVPEAVVGDYVNVHVGFALGVIDQEEAFQVFEYLREIGELAEAEKEGWGAAVDDPGAGPSGPGSAPPPGGTAA